jgi:hypothetical protein
MTTDQRLTKNKDARDQELSEELETTLPSSDAPSLTQPRGGVQPEERSELIRQRAYAIWIDEGQVHGRDEEHWREAERQVAAEMGSE